MEAHVCSLNCVMRVWMRHIMGELQGRQAAQWFCEVSWGCMQHRTACKALRLLYMAPESGMLAG